MKRQVRYGVFETNSSSCHSISIRDLEPTLLIEFGEFGWGYEEYNDMLTKLKYILTMAAETNIYWKTKEEFLETEDFIKINDLIKTETPYRGGIEFNDSQFPGEQYNRINGYIDHQSYEGYKNIQDFLDDYGVTLYDFIFNPEVVLIIDNDNH